MGKTFGAFIAFLAVVTVGLIVTNGNQVMMAMMLGAVIGAIVASTTIFVAERIGASDASVIDPSVMRVRALQMIQRNGDKQK